MVNYYLGDLVTRLNVASKNRLVSIRVQNTNYNIDLLTLFYNNGLISGFRIYPNFI
jgi:ribosomal protein S8